MDSKTVNLNVIILNKNPSNQIDEQLCHQNNRFGIVSLQNDKIKAS